MKTETPVNELSDPVKGIMSLGIPQAIAEKLGFFSREDSHALAFPQSLTPDEVIISIIEHIAAYSEGPSSDPDTARSMRLLMEAAKIVLQSKARVSINAENMEKMITVSTIIEFPLEAFLNGILSNYLDQLVVEGRTGELEATTLLYSSIEEATRITDRCDRFDGKKRQWTYTREGEGWTAHNMVFGSRPDYVDPTQEEYPTELMARLAIASAVSAGEQRPLEVKPVGEKFTVEAR